MPLTREVYYPTGLVDRGSDVYLFARIIFVLLYRGTCGEAWEVILGSDGRCGAGPDADADADADAGINATRLVANWRDVQDANRIHSTPKSEG
ncbi:hypothetical protein GX48_00822 [Paracoccidioides brasiliensis]|nr:hypothetical protein GX48_00822 [Paracoccidioides brasiliensis]